MRMSYPAASLEWASTTRSRATGWSTASPSAPPAGVCFAHMPVHGLGHPDAEGSHLRRYARILRILQELDGLSFASLRARERFGLPSAAATAGGCHSPTARSTSCCAAR
jgi:hypothetical protein